MAIDFKTLVTLLTFVSNLQKVCLVPIYKDSKLSRTDSAILSYDGVNLVRVKKELVRVGWCSQGKQRHFGKCMTQKQYQRVMDSEYDDRVPNAETKNTVAVPKKEIAKKVDAPDKTAVKTHTTTMHVLLHPEQLYSTEKTRRNDISDGMTTETTSTTVYHVSDVEELQNIESTQDEYSDTATTKVSSTTVYHVSDLDELQSTESTQDEYSDTIAIETTSIPYNVFGAEELDKTLSRFDADAMGSQAVTSKSDVNLERVTNLTSTLLMVGGGAVVLAWLFKLLYDYYFRKEDRTTYISCSTDEIHDSASSRQRLCLRS